MTRLGLMAAMAALTASCDAGPATTATPPSGTYAVTMRVVTDDCTPKYEPPPPWQVEIDSKATDAQVLVNVPLSALPPANDTTTAARNSLLLQPVTPLTRKLTRSGGCEGDELRIEPTGVSATSFTLAITATYAAASEHCKATPPAGCTTKVEQVFTLAKP